MTQDLPVSVSSLDTLLQLINSSGKLVLLSADGYQNGPAPLIVVFLASTTNTGV